MTGGKDKLLPPTQPHSLGIDKNKLLGRIVGGHGDHAKLVWLIFGWKILKMCMMRYNAV